MRTFQATNREASSNNDSFAQRSTGPCVCIGNRDWISSKSKSDGTHHALNCDSILDSMVSIACKNRLQSRNLLIFFSKSMAIPSWLSSSRCGRRSDFLWANLSCGETERSGHRENELKRLEEIMVCGPYIFVEDICLSSHIIFFEHSRTKCIIVCPFTPQYS